MGKGPWDGYMILQLSWHRPELQLQKCGEAVSQREQHSDRSRHLTADGFMIERILKHGTDGNNAGNDLARLDAKAAAAVCLTQRMHFPTR